MDHIPSEMELLGLRALWTSTTFKETSCKLAIATAYALQSYKQSRVGMKKNKELFFFFYINDTRAFKKYLASQIHPRITTTTQLLDLNLQPVTAVNVAFSQSGLTALGVNDNLGDSHFSNGQFAEHAELGDPGTDGWVEGLKGTRTHGVFLLARFVDCACTARRALAQ